ncbi:hypothetical protein RI367_004324 [Sorochytrium milnesiophthora]
MSAGGGEIPPATLEAVRAQLHELAGALHSLEMHHTLWSMPDITEQFNVITLKFLSLQHALGKSLQDYIVLPYNHPFDARPPEYIPANLLRTMVVPEVQAAEDSIVDSVHSDMLSLPRPDVTAQTAKRQKFAAPSAARQESEAMTATEELALLQRRTRTHDRLANELYARFQAVMEKHKPDIFARYEDADEDDNESTASLASNDQDQEDTGADLPPTASHAAAPSAATTEVAAVSAATMQQSLEQALRFMSSGATPK